MIKPPSDPDLDALRGELQRFCDAVKEPVEPVAYARTHFDQAIFWLRAARDRQRESRQMAVPA